MKLSQHGADLVLALSSLLEMEEMPSEEKMQVILKLLLLQMKKLNISLHKLEDYLLFLTTEVTEHEL